MGGDISGRDGIRIFGMVSGSIAARYSYDANFALNTWYHVIVVDTGNAYTLYIDGSEKTLSVTNAGSVDFTSFSSPTVDLGRARSGGGVFNYLDGKMDEVRIYDRALSVSEIASLYNSGLAHSVGSAKINTSQNNRLTDGLVGMWSFNGQDMYGATVFDGSGNGSDGTLINGPSVVPGKVGQALNFDGDTSYVELPNDAMPSFSEITIAGWIYPMGENDDASNDWQMIIDLRRQYNFLVRWFEADFSTPAFVGVYALVNGSAKQPGSTSNSFPVGEWNHFAVVHDGLTMDIYKNGVFNAGVAAVGAVNSISPASNYRNLIGKDYIPSNDRLWFYGSMDEIRVYDKALSPM